MFYIERRITIDTSIDRVRWEKRLEEASILFRGLGEFWFSYKKKHWEPEYIRKRFFRLNDIWLAMLQKIFSLIYQLTINKNTRKWIMLSYRIWCIVQNLYGLDVKKYN